MKKKKKREEKQKKRVFAHWLNQQQREGFLVTASLTMAFCFLIILVFSLSSVLRQTQRLTLENALERSFNDIIFDLEQGRNSESDILSPNLVGVGIYNSSGALVASWGRVYNMLPVATIAEQAAEQGDSMMNYNSRTKLMEYIRFLRQSLPLNSASFISTGLLGPVAVQDSSLIVYLAFDGSQYIQRLNLIYLVSFIALIGLILLYVFVMKIYRQNRLYREQMNKQNSLVNLGQAARTLTHEIKNPLSAITIQIALLKRQLKDSPYLDEVMLIESESQRLIQLTNRVSDFLRNPEGKPEQIDVAALIDHLIPLFAYPIKILETSVRPAYILFDPDRLRSVVENVLKNAVESCEGRDPQVEVEIVLGRRGMYHIYIRDRGDGIQGDVEKLFDPFYTTKIHGSGIGLSISRQFLRARGGDIRIYSRPQGGTVVELIVARYSYVQELVVPAARAKRKKK